MRSTGIVRKVDELGRVVIPIDLRRKLSIEEYDCLEINVQEDTILLRKHFPSCVFCQSKDDVIKFKNRFLCMSCIRELTE